MLQSNIEAAARVQKLIKGLEKSMGELKQELEGYKTAILSEMQRTNSKRTDTFDGYYVTRSIRSTPMVTDSSQLEDWMVSNDLNPEEYKKFDSSRVILMANSLLKETGELIPGIETNSTEYLSFRSDK